ncbi:uncharacterized protein NEMAJ01_0002 [Nematocida major]|uniref:uncharacterized protein n=1 Tax=Nematocida major TaxID=1912982 RepID=UPI002007B57C|nr:uncharacterized protein NEMAJ01_0002 [Nematocida major]KAH9385106.1 hypothetical protein NEMAJ01_0002 [Nematocida major]
MALIKNKEEKGLPAPRHMHKCGGEGVEALPHGIFSREVKSLIARVLRNEPLREEEIKRLLKIGVIWPVLKPYLLLNIEKYNALNLLDVLCERQNG